MSKIKDRVKHFWSKVKKLDNGCWEWQAGQCEGYGIFWDGKSIRAHIYAYALLIGPVPEGFVLDHLCRNTLCCNPDHLEPVTKAVNTLRGMHPNIITHRAGICRNGHEQTDENTAPTSNGKGRYCLICKRETDARYREERKEERKAYFKDRYKRQKAA